MLNSRNVLAGFLINWKREIKIFLKWLPWQPNNNKRPGLRKMKFLLSCDGEKRNFTLKRKNRPTSRSLKNFSENNLIFSNFLTKNAPLNEARGWSLYLLDFNRRKLDPCCAYVEYFVTR